MIAKKEKKVQAKILQEQNGGKKKKRILPQDVNARVFFDNIFTSLAIFFISSLLLTRPHCWHVNPLSSADSSSAKKKEKKESVTSAISMMKLKVFSYQNLEARSHCSHHPCTCNLLE